LEIGVSSEQEKATVKHQISASLKIDQTETKEIDVSSKIVQTGDWCQFENCLNRNQTRDWCQFGFVQTETKQEFGVSLVFVQTETKQENSHPDRSLSCYQIEHI